MGKNELFMVIGIVVTFVMSFLALFDVDGWIFYPDIKVKIQFADSVIPITKEGETQTEQPSLFATYALVTISNNGTAPATNLRVVINPEHEIINLKREFSIEKTFEDPRGTRSYVIESPRLTKGDYMQFSFITKAPIEEENFHILIAFDQKEPIHFISKNNEKEYMVGYPSTKYRID